MLPIPSLICHGLCPQGGTTWSQHGHRSGHTSFSHTGPAQSPPLVSRNSRPHQLYLLASGSHWQRRPSQARQVPWPRLRGAALTAGLAESRF